MVRVLGNLMHRKVPRFQVGKAVHGCTWPRQPPRFPKRRITRRSQDSSLVESQTLLPN